MKKVLVVLLIAVLAVGSVFAAVSGSVEAGYTFDFEEKTAEYNLGGAYSKLSFTLITDSGSSTGSDKPYATATVDLAIFDWTVAKNSSFTWDWTEDGVTYAATPDGDDDINAMANFTLSDFRIVGENWEVDFLKAALFGNYAKSAWEVDSTSSKKAISYNNVPADAEKGFTVTYDDYTVGVGFESSSTYSHALLSTETKAIEFEGGSAQAAVNVAYFKIADEEAEFYFIPSVKADYSVSDVALSVAADAGIAKEYFEADVSLTASYKPVVFDFFYATEISKPAKAYADTENILSVRAQFDVAELAEDVKVKLTVKAENLINDQKILSAEAEVTAIENLDLTVGFNDWLKNGDDAQYLFAEAEYTGIEDVTLSANAGYSFGGKVFDAGITAKYAAEKFTVVCAGVLEAAEDADAKLAGRIGVSSDVIIDNATIGADLVFDKNALLSDYSDSNYLKAYAKVTF